MSDKLTLQEVLLNNPNSSVEVLEYYPQAISFIQALNNVIKYVNELPASDVAQLKEQVTQLTASVDNLKVSLNQTNSNLETTNNNTEKNTQDISTNTINISKNTGDIETNTNVINAHTVDISQLETKDTEIDEQILALQNNDIAQDGNISNILTLLNGEDVTSKFTFREGVTTSSLSAKKVGNIVFVAGSLKHEGNIATANTVFSINDSSLRPNSNCNFTGISGNSGFAISNIYKLTLTPSGNCQIYYDNANITYYFTFCYIVR